jgi:CRISPR-associated protein Cas2
MLVMVSYDIADHKRRCAVSNLLKNFGQRVQRSVFECDISASQLGEVRAGISDCIDAGEDSIRFYAFCSACRSNVEVSGGGTPSEEDDGYYVV